MPTPGPWQNPLQLTIPGSRSDGGRDRRARNDTETFHPGFTSTAEIDMLVNERRATLDEGTISTVLLAGSPLESRCSVSVFYEEEIDGAYVASGEASDHGWWFSADLTSGWTAYLSAVSGAAVGAGASGYEIEGGTSPHIVSVDAADITIPVVLTGGPHPLISMKVDIRTIAAADYTSLDGVATLRETRGLETSYPVDGFGGTESLDPITLHLSPTDFHADEGGVHVYPDSTQGESPAWNTRGFLTAEVVPEIRFRSEGTVTATYDVTFPRYRLLFDGDSLPSTDESVTRLYPRDDNLGLGSASRLYPPPRRGRIYPAQL